MELPINSKPGEVETPLVREIAQCRSCGFEPLAEILSLGKLCVSDFVDNEVSPGQELPLPLELVLCNAGAGGCGLLQLKHTTSRDEMYRQYWYRSGVNQTMSRELEEIAQTASRIAPLHLGDIVVDIGANDGTLLKAYTIPGLIRVGFEPAQNLIPDLAAHASRVFSDYFTALPFLSAFLGKRAKVITAIAMFYDLDDPNAFVRDIGEVLDHNGVFIIQQAYLPVMLRTNGFDNMIHEHLEYYSFLSLTRLLDRHGLEVFDIEFNDINGGSFRTYIRHCGSLVGSVLPGAAERVREAVVAEAKLGLADRGVYDDFGRRVEAVREKLTSFVRAESAAGKRIYVYGASTKGNTILQFCGLDHTLIPAAAERNPAKWGKKTVATHIPIISEEQARAESPDYFLVLPWFFLPEFREREAAYLRAGGQFIVPLPELRLIGSEGEVRLA